MVKLTAQKKKLLIIIAAAAVVVVLLAVLLAVSTDRQSSLKQKRVTEGMSQSELQKAKNVSNSVVYNFKSKKSAKADAEWLSNSVFDCVVLKAPYLTAKAETDTKAKTAEDDELSQALDFAAALKKKKLKVYFQVDISHSESFIAELCRMKNSDGVVLVGVQKTAVYDLNEKLKAIAEKTGEERDNKKIILSLDAQNTDSKTMKLDPKSIDAIFSVVPAEAETQSFFAAVKNLTSSLKVPAMLCFQVGKCSENEAYASMLLEKMLEADSCGFTFSRAFDSYSDVRNDYEGCFSAAEKFINNGINPPAVYSKLIIENYDGKTVETNSFSVKLNIRGSYLYPVMLGKSRIELSESGKAEVNLPLEAGENTFLFKQNENTQEYKINVTFDGEVISSVEPSAELEAHEGKTEKVKITAVKDASVTLRLGTKKYTAKQGEYIGNGYCVYTAKVKMPSSKLEIQSLGKITVNAFFEGRNVTVDGPQIIYAEKAVQPTDKTHENTQVQENATLPADNYNGYVTEPSVSVPVSVSAPAAVSGFVNSGMTTAPPLQGSATYTGNEMCVVTASNADTWPLGNDDKFVPYYTTLTRGTMDYVVGQSQAYDSEEDVTRTFYSLASGRRIQQKDVALQPKTEMGDNTISVISSTAENGKLKIVLSSKWKVPYTVSFAPQEYYASESKLYNVRSFTASYIQFAFFYTTDAQGQVSVSGSDVAASASWSVDPSQKTAVLTIQLKAAGEFYGYCLEYDANGNTVITIKNKPKSLSGSVIVLDPGHGGKDSGAPGYGKIVNEKAINFSAAVMVKNELERRGATVYLTRYEDKYVSLEERKEFARAVKPDIFVSLHCNASESESPYGTSVYYYKPMSQPLSQSIYNELTAVFKNYVYANDTARRQALEKGSNFNPFSVTRLEECPSVLVEMGFISNETECQKLLDDTCRQKIATAIADGIEKYIL